MAQPAKQKQAPERVAFISQAYAPPASPEAEQSVLGAVLVTPEKLDAVSVMITAADFYQEAHGRIFQTMLDLREIGKALDLVTVSALLKERGQLAGVGGPVFLAGLSEQVGFATNAEAYAAIVRDKARLRRFADKMQQVTGACFAPVENVGEFLDHAVMDIFEATESAQQNQAVFLDDLVASESQIIEGIYYKKQQPGIPVGFQGLGRLFYWTPGDLIILAARPSIGKTSLAINFCWKLALAGVYSGFVTLETSKEQLTRRFMAHIGEISGYRMSQGKLSGTEWQRFALLQAEVDSMPLWIDDTPALSIGEIRARARRQHGMGKLDFLVVDYLQLTKPVHRGRSREEEVAEVSRGLKALAKELHIPVLAISSLNRKCEERTDKRPIMADLRESGAIEFDADLILFLYRDEVYRKNSPDKGIAEIEVAKHKNGPIGLVKMAYQGECYRFKDLAEESSHS